MTERQRLREVYLRGWTDAMLEVETRVCEFLNSNRCTMSPPNKFIDQSLADDCLFPISSKGKQHER